MGTVMLPVESQPAVSTSQANVLLHQPEDGRWSGLGRRWKRIPFTRAFLLSLVLHTLLPVLVLLLLGVLGYLLPEPKIVEPLLEFTLVKHPSEGIPKQPDAKGNKPQQGGGQLHRQAQQQTLPAKQVSTRQALAPKSDPPPKSQALPITPPPPPIVLDDTEDLPIPEKPSVTNAAVENERVPSAEDPAASVGDAAEAQLAVTPDAMAPYFAELKKRLTRNWHPPRGENSLQVVVLFTIKKNGEVETVDIKESSGDSAVDAAAIAAVRQSSPLEALPEAWGVTTSLPILFTFDYTVFGKRRVAGPQ